MFNQRQILITGACGFIGSNLVEECLNKGWYVTAVDNMSNGYLEFFNEFQNHQNLEMVRCDFSSRRVEDLLKQNKYDNVFHLAACPRVGYSVEFPVETNEQNVNQTLEFMTTCRDANVGRFIFASSSATYGNTEVLPTPESIRKSPQSPYGLQKSIIEDYLSIYWYLYKMDSVSLRFFNVFGKNALGSSPYATALAAWLTAIKSGKSMRLDGDGTQTRDLCHVDNVVHALILAAESPSESLRGQRYNVGSGEAISNKELSEYLLNRYPFAYTHNAPERIGDVKHTLANITKIKNQFGYRVKVPIWEGVEKTCKWYDENWNVIKKLTLKV